ncbi:hypothetical protein K435DRAFT_718186 [Dendrothele bispora CBS 962.96]|uniref:MYND-type domain-containing protein n=1 Tax=Dendrothele bispora (strain CBS 962.96) TaxID=1314807 RepID=A0A4S8MF59_DENBC|nr:hypothetical protein K435DRAFT_718186 [Dendrothele bispora CBS 962.96]
MAQPLNWPGKYFLYAIGNTSAHCLTRDIPLETPANILLLGCGDPRSILYTITCESESVSRKLDFTCCDFDPAVLARNVLLLSLIIDKKPHTTIVWDIFFHIHLEKRSLSVLIEQCHKLITISNNLQDWNESPYGQFMKMSTAYTLAEMRRHWTLYTEMHTLPPERLKKLQNAFKGLFESMRKQSIATAARSAGPLGADAMQVVIEQFKSYWKKGVTSLRSGQVAAANVLNPTFCYSLAGEGCNVHYGTDPMSPFHLVELFGNARQTPSAGDLVRAAKTEFDQWCSAFYSAITSSRPETRPIVRFFLGEATAVCHSLHLFSETGTTSTGIPLAQWKAQTITLSNEADGYHGGGSASAPTTFDVIDTSNLCDNVGLLNVLIATKPLLRFASPSSGVLYTESLLFRGQDATKEFAERLYGDITTIGLLIGLCPVDYVSGFSTRSNLHELMTHGISSSKESIGQFQQLTTWRKPSTGDALSGQAAIGLLYSFDPWQLGTFLYDMYHKLFEQEDSKHFDRINRNIMMKAIVSADLIYYMRESFVLFLKLVRDHLRIPGEVWTQIMDRFHELDEADTSLPMNANNRHDLWAHLYLHRLYTVPYYIYRIPQRRLGLFSAWDSVPLLVRVFLTVPRDKLNVFSGSNVGTPLLQCDIAGITTHNIFTSLHVAFGKVIPIGTASNPRILFEEDPQGRQGTSPLIVSFLATSYVLTDLEPQENVQISFGLRSSAGSVPFIAKLGLMLRVFSAKLLDKEHVIVLPEQPITSNKSDSKPPAHSPVSGSGLKTQIGQCEDIAIGLDEDCELVASLTRKVLVKGEEPKRLFADRKTSVSATQLSPCVMRIAIQDYVQDIAYPFPVIGSEYRLRLARTSLYIEVIVPPFGPMKPEGMKLNLFPTVGLEGHFTPWNIHRVNLSRSPVIDIKAPRVEKWLNPLAGLQMSTRERSLRKHQGHDKDTLMAIKDTLHAIIVGSAGIQHGPARRLFALRDNDTNNCDTLFFISNMRYDLVCHTVMCEGYVLPLTVSLLFKIQKVFGQLVHKGDLANITTYAGEMKAWKQLLPALVERCRSSWTHGPNCEYLSKGQIPLTVEMEEIPICSCGRGKDVEGMLEVELWKHFAPYVTKVALTPLFAVSYLETVVRDPAARRCFVCRARGKPKIKTCTVCKKVRYCSEECQRKDWKKHKTVCKPPA